MRGKILLGIALIILISLQAVTAWDARQTRNAVMLSADSARWDEVVKMLEKSREELRSIRESTPGARQPVFEDESNPYRTPTIEEDARRGSDYPAAEKPKPTFWERLKNLF